MLSAVDCFFHTKLFFFAVFPKSVPFTPMSIAASEFPFIPYFLYTLTEREPIMYVGHSP